MEQGGRGFLCGLCGGATCQNGEGLLWESLVGEEFELAPREHVGRESMHVGGLKVEVLEHSIGFPPANQLDQQGADMGTEEHHGMAPPTWSAGVETSLGCKPSSGILRHVWQSILVSWLLVTLVVIPDGR
jgi:hypothetical protein